MWEKAFVTLTPVMGTSLQEEAIGLPSISLNVPQEGKELERQREARRELCKNENGVPQY